TSRILCAAARLKVLRIVSFSSRRMLESESSSSPAARTGPARANKNSKPTEYIRMNVRNLCFITAPSDSFQPKRSLAIPGTKTLVQLLDSPIHALLYRRIDVWVLLKFSELRHCALVMQVHQQVNQCHLHHGRLRGLKHIDQLAAHFRSICIAAQRIQGGQAHVHVIVKAYGVHQSA